MQHRDLESASFLRPSLLGSACILLLAACTSSAAPEQDPITGLPVEGQLRLQLQRADSCSALLTRIQDGLLVPLAERATQLRRGGGGGSGYATPGLGIAAADTAPPPVSVGAAGTGSDGAVANGAAAVGSAGSSSGSSSSGSSTAVPAADTPASNTASSSPAGGPAASDGASAAPEAPGAASGTGKDASGFSSTTVQVKDVDEADIVKTDGDQIYVLHGGSLLVLRGWPANDTALVGSATVEGQPLEMFVREGKALVFSSVYGDLEASAAGKETPDGIYRGGSGYTKLTVFDVSADTPAVLRESYVEGNYVSSRRQDGLVRAVVQDGFKVPDLGSPYIQYVDAFGQPFPQADIDAQVDDWLERTVRSVRSTHIEDWLPREFSKQSGQLVAEAPRCGDYYSPDPGLTQSGVTSVVSLDLDDVAGALSGATILGQAERVYANDSALLVTQSDYRYLMDQGALQQTIIHRFDIRGPSTTYVASGAVAGSIQNQFSLDEQDGVIRVSTTEQRYGVARPVAIASETGVAGSAATTPTIAPDPAGMANAGTGGAGATVPANGPINRVLTLRTDGDSLVQLGATEDFGAGETIYGTRFLGDRGYVVTFHQTDPLFVVDLADPARPSVVGELTIPGFSNYLFPIDGDHLFAIGQDATQAGQLQGLALSIFDVSNPAQPALAQKYVYADPGYSPANVDQRAISFHPNGGVVAFPYQKYDTGEDTLEVLRFSAQDGFTRLGSIGEPIDYAKCLSNYGLSPADTSSVANNPELQKQYGTYCQYNAVYFQRGLFRDNFVYGISSEHVYVSALDALDGGSLQSVSLPPETYDYGSYGVGVAEPGMTGSGPVPLPPTKALPPSSGGAAGAGASIPYMHPEAGSGEYGGGAGGAAGSASTDDTAGSAGSAGSSN